MVTRIKLKDSKGKVMGDEVTDIFMHGLCAQLQEYIRLELGFPCINVHDMDYELDNMDVLVHSATRLPNGSIIDAKNIYDNEEDFLKYVRETYEELDRFYIAEPLNARLMIKSQLKNTGTLEECLDKNDKERYNYPKLLVSYIKGYFGTFEKLSIEKALNTQIGINSKYPQMVEKMLNKNDSYQYKLFRNSQNYKDLGYGVISTRFYVDKDRYILFLNTSAFYIDKEQSIFKIIYKYGVGSTVQDRVNSLKTYRDRFNLNPDILEFPRTLTLRFKPKR